MDFKATHIITHEGQEIPCMLTDHTMLWTEQEWERMRLGFWDLVDGQLLWDGEPTTATIRPVDDLSRQ